MPDRRYHLILGTPVQSSWSMRAYFCASPMQNQLSVSWREFDAGDHLTDTEGCPTGQVPVLRIEGLDQPVLETFVIAETLADYGGLGWPDDRQDRAVARSLCLEFQHQSETLRKTIPMNLADVTPGLSPNAELDFWLQRLNTQLGYSGGDFLFGEMGIADAWFAPVIARAIRADAIDGGRLAAYKQRLLRAPAWRQWLEFVPEALPAYRSS